jgi:hypothetical protein
VRLCLGYHYSVETLSARYAECANVVWADFGDARGGLYLMLGPMELSAVHRDTTPGFCADRIIRRLEIYAPQDTTKIRLLATPSGKGQDEPDKTIPC